MARLTIATRESALALWQANHIKNRIETLHEGIEVQLLPMSSKGDRILDRPLALVGGKGHFTKALEDVMLAGKADMAVHSLKDVPTYIPEGLSLAAITRREEQSDVLLSYRYESLEALPRGAVVGTTSLRRRMQLLRKRPDLEVKDLRGNVNTRLRKLKEGSYDAIILAYIGMERLGLLEEITYVQKLDFIPPMGQAALGIEIVSSSQVAQEVAQKLNHPETYLCTMQERAFVSKVGAGCSAPVAVNATIKKGMMRIEAMVGMADGSEVLHGADEAPLDRSDGLGEALASEMTAQGAQTLLARAERASMKAFLAQRI